MRFKSKSFTIERKFYLQWFPCNEDICEDWDNDIYEEGMEGIADSDNDNNNNDDVNEIEVHGDGVGESV